MPLYESTFIVRQDLSSNDVDKLTETFSKIITDNGGNIVKTEYWGLRTLAYIIKKNRKGHYVMLGIDAPYEAVKEMERRIKLNEDILRNVTIKVDEIDKEASVIMNSRSSDYEEETVNPGVVQEEVESEKVEADNE
jgi:small subunit ribosomal protein S6